MFVFQLVFERRMERTNAVNIVVIRTNNIPFVFDHHCSPFKMKNTRGRQEEREGGRKERSVSDFQTNGDSAKKAARRHWNRLV